MRQVETCVMHFKEMHKIGGEGRGRERGERERGDREREVRGETHREK